MEPIRRFFEENDKFAKACGIEILEVGHGTSKCRMRVERRHLNGVDTAHGGAVFTLADTAFAAAVNSEGPVAVAIQAGISYLQAAREGDMLTADARVISWTPKIAVCDVDVTDGHGRLMAAFQGTAYRKSRGLSEEKKLNTE